jgi:putative ABC transport system substrate-binding protein
LAPKCLELIRTVVPAVARIAVLDGSDDPFPESFLDQFSKAAQTHRLAIHSSVTVRGDNEGELAGAFAVIARELNDAVMIRLPVHKLIIDLTLRYRLPSFSTEKFMTKAGALASYSAGLVERARGVADYVNKILKGAKPADLPVLQPTKFEMAINLKTAKALGLEVPDTLLARADEVIE